MIVPIYSHQYCTKLPTSLHSHYFIFDLTVANLIGRYIPIILICISVITSEVRTIFHMHTGHLQSFFQLPANVKHPSLTRQLVFFLTHLSLLCIGCIHFIHSLERYLLKFCCLLCSVLRTLFLSFVVQNNFGDFLTRLSK